MNTLSVAIIQNSAGQDPAANLEGLSGQLATLGSTDLVALPEIFSLRGSEQELRDGAEPLDGPTACFLSDWARSHGSWVLGGSLLEREGDHIYNTSQLFNREGTRVAAYRKIHLFEVHLEDGTNIREAAIYAAGDTTVTADLEGWTCGFSICYDLRFPELFRTYAREGANLLFMPSNFTHDTGQDHWHTLVRARAIENQCFVVAPAQCGENPSTKVMSYGHSMAVGPWGEGLGEAGEEEEVLQVTLDPVLLGTARTRLPALKHRRL